MLCFKFTLLFKFACPSDTVTHTSKANYLSGTQAQAMVRGVRRAQVKRIEEFYLRHLEGMESMSLAAGRSSGALRALGPVSTPLVVLVLAVAALVLGRGA